MESTCPKPPAPWFRQPYWLHTTLFTLTMLCYAKSLQSCPTLCDPIDSSPPGSPVPGILQARTLAWVAISFSNTWKWKVKVKLLSRVRLSATPWTAAYQAPPSMGFSRQEYWSEVPLPSPVMYVVLSYLCLLLHSVFWKVPGGKEPGTSMAYFVYFLSFRDHSFMLPIVTSLESGLFPVIFVQFYNCFWQESKCRSS